MIVTAIDLSHGLEGILNSLMTQGAALGWTLIKAFLVFIVGRLLINLVNKLIKRVLLKRDIDPSVKTFVGSLVNVVLTILLIISVVGALGVQTTSFAAPNTAIPSRWPKKSSASALSTSTSARCTSSTPRKVRTSLPIRSSTAIPMQKH